MKGAQSRERVVATALRLFHERGYASTSLSDVAKEAGLLKGNLAYYFKTKPDLLAAVTEARQRALGLALSGEGDAGTHPSDALNAPPLEVIGRLLDQCRGLGRGTGHEGLPAGQPEHGTRKAQRRRPASPGSGSAHWLA